MASVLHERRRYGSIVEASERMARLGEDEYLPNESTQPVYDDLYSIYKDLHDTMAGPSSGMRKLRSVQERARKQTVVPV